MKDENDIKTADLLDTHPSGRGDRMDPAATAPPRPLNAARNVGRPRVHDSAAARQKTYRARLRETGKRVVSRTVVDRRGGDTIKSDVILIPVFYRTR